MDKSLSLGTSSSKPPQRPALATAAVEQSLARIAKRPSLVTVARVLAPAQLFLVGGLVRDAFFGLADTDLDIATNLTPLEVVARCTAHKIKVIETGIEHGTVLLVAEDEHVEVTTFRVPSERTSHTTARDLDTDLAGRDFTINALAFDLHTLTLKDPFNGAQDIYDGVVRGIHNPAARFDEDPLRVLRAIRFGQAAGRVIDPKTFSAAQNLVHTIERVSVERIKSELDKILLADYPVDGIRGLKSLGALPYTIPELLPCIGFEQNDFHIEDVFDHTMTVLSRTPPDTILRWAAVFHDIGKPHTLTTDENGRRHFYSHETVSERLAISRMEHLRFSHDEMKAIGLIVKQHMRQMDCGAPGVRRIVRDLGGEYDRWRTFKWADISPTMPEEQFNVVASNFDTMKAAEAARLAGPSYGKLAVDGTDLIALGMKPGPSMGKLLKELEEVVLDDPSLNTKEYLLGVIRSKTNNGHN